LMKKILPNLIRLSRFKQESFPVLDNKVQDKKVRHVS